MSSSLLIFRESAPPRTQGLREDRCLHLPGSRASHLSPRLAEGGGTQEGGGMWGGRAEVSRLEAEIARLEEENARLWRVLIVLGVAVGVLLVALHMPEGVVGLVH